VYLQTADDIVNDLNQLYPQLNLRVSTKTEAILVKAVQTLLFPQAMTSQSRENDVFHESESEIDIDFDELDRFELLLVKKKYPLQATTPVSMTSVPLLTHPKTSTSESSQSQRSVIDNVLELDLNRVSHVSSFNYVSRQFLLFSGLIHINKGNESTGKNVNEHRV
jgi:hypothetical protein